MKEKEPKKPLEKILFDSINKANISQRDRFFLLLLLISVIPLRGYTELALAKTVLPPLVDIILKLLGLK